MLKNIFKLAFRNLIRHFGYTLINILGLAIGLASSIFIFLYVFNELNYDRFHEKADQIYRVSVRGQMPGNELNQAVTAEPMMQALLSDYPEVEEASRIFNFGDRLVRTGEKKFQETQKDFIFVDSTFFNVFSFKLLRGDPETVLTRPRSLVLTENYARKYFGDADPVGQTVKVEEDTSLYQITGVMENVPINSHFHFNMLGSLSTFGTSRNNNWLNHNYYTYVVLAPGTDIQKFTEGMRDMVIKYVGPMIEQYIGIGLDQFEEAGNSFGYFLQPLTDIHLHSNLQFEIEPSGNPVYVYIFIVIGILILVIACINFMNLATARATTRAREVGLRKVVGSHRSLLVYQFLAESIFLSLFSLVIAVVLVYLLLPAYNNLIRLDLVFSIFSKGYNIPLLILLALFVGIVAGIYPALILASFKPVTVLKTELQAGSSKSFLRNMLVVLQFAATIVILLGTSIAGRQLNFMQRKDLGFDKNNILVIRRADVMGDRVDAFKQEILQHANINGVANSTHFPSTKYWNNAHWIEGQDLSNTLLLMTCYNSYNIEEALGLELVDGRFFSREMPTDSFAVVINESAVQTLAISDPLNTRFLIPANTGGGEDQYLPVIGVVKDFHYESMREDIHPMIMHFMPGNFGGYVIARFGGGDVTETLRYIQQIWEDFSTDFPFEYVWLNDEYNQLFEPEKRSAQILLVFSILSIFISCLGLLGLISYSTSQRTREIGIRKSMGASSDIIVMMLSRETLTLMGIATLLAVPAYFGINRWLQNFAYHIGFNIGVYFLILMIVSFVILFIALLTVSYQSYRASIANPARSLRAE